MTRPNPLPELKAGDILLYYSNWSIVDWFIAWRTWSDVAHIEIYRGSGLSFASRNGIGVNIYPFRREGLRYVLRPNDEFDLESALKGFQKLRGLPYGFWDLLVFFSIKRKTKGLICSQLGDLVLQLGKIIAFSTVYFDGAIAPRDYEITPAARQIWKWKV